MRPGWRRWFLGCSREMTNGEAITDTGAVAALASPLWLPALHTASEIAALVLPILGAAWLAVQIVLKLYLFYKTRAKP